ncbi:carbohydrate ABC transporter permease [Paenibacillus riograndensis]|uniref:Binding-protein-dependent transporters inner membrane component n=1 Tax=Paenibacillus riograndensis SBR5 TaxID=1073571 RepID=A0A0E3WG33_9BACL|nr:sugar ABC transporter permease [Paenibacillus riograndensis]CQR51653.1 binding-protein-dependent transporters inner membrane component [Paenibacillus riograndensis SBR5]
MHYRTKQIWSGYLSLAPAFLALAVFIFYPMVNTFLHSFTKWDGNTARWIGLSNYKFIFTNGELWTLLRNNAIFLLSIPGILLLSLIVSVLLFEQMPGWRFFRSLYYIPTILSSVVVGLLMKSMFSPSGVVNQWIGALGLPGGDTEWLAYTPTAFMVLIFCFYWQTLGQGVLLFLSGLSSVSPEIFESASIDGAGWWQRLFHIVIPSLVPTIAYFTVTNVIYCFIGLFSLVYAVTRGGPGLETTPIDYMIYIKAFQSPDQLGYASALSIVLFAIVLFVSWLQLRLSSRFEN